MSRLIIVFIILFLLDLYAYKGLLSLTSNLSAVRVKAIKIIYWTLSLIVIFQLINIFSRFREYTSDHPEAFQDNPKTFHSQDAPCQQSALSPGHQHLLCSHCQI